MERSRKDLFLIKQTFFKTGIIHVIVIFKFKVEVKREEKKQHPYVWG